MRIEQEVRSFYFGVQQNAETKTPEEVKESLEKGRVFAGKQAFGTDKIAERRRQAQEKAMNIVKTAFVGEQILDTSIAEMESSIEKGKEEMVAQKAELNKIVEQKEALKKRTDLTGAEYEAELTELNKAEAHFTGLIADGKKYEDRTLQALSDIKIERAKSNPMVSATKEAEEALSEGGKTVVNLLFEEAKEHLDAEQEKLQKEAEEKKAKEQELEERIEAMKAEKKEKEEGVAPATEHLETATRRMVTIAETGQSIQKELQNVVDKLKLDLEDLKGAAVDQEV